MVNFRARKVDPNPNLTILPLCQWSNDIAKKDKLDYEERRRKELDIVPKSEYYAAAEYERKVTTGDEKLADLVEALDRLDEIGFKRSSAQRQFHRYYISACLKKIYGKDLNRNLARILKEHELEELRSDVIVSTPRRWGKTFSVALYVAAYLWSQPGCEVSIYSTGRRASRKILALIWKMVVALSGGESIIKEYNVENLVICGKRGGISKCFSYPSKVQIDAEGRRKRSGQVIVCESHYYVCLDPSLSLSCSHFYFLYILTSRMEGTKP